MLRSTHKQMADISHEQVPFHTISTSFNKTDLYNTLLSLLKNTTEISYTKFIFRTKNYNKTNSQSHLSSTYLIFYFYNILLLSKYIANATYTYTK